jgi:steroid delta-isomerase-like uncharacterized protein
MGTGSELVAGLELWAQMREKRGARADEESIGVNAPRSILQSALAALAEGKVSEIVALFDDQFTFNDHGLSLEFSDKGRLTEFFNKSRELFPDTKLEVLSIFEDRDHAIAEWKLSATHTEPYGSICCHFPVSLYGSTFVRIENERIVRWSDYYDYNSSRRMSLATYFTEWIEY